MLILLARDSSSNASRDLVCSIRPKTRLVRNTLGLLDTDAAAQWPNQFQLQIGAFQEDGASAFHLVECPTDVAGLKVNSPAAIDDNMCIQSECTRIERAVLDAVIQGEAHQVDVFDPALLQVMS